MNLQPLPNDHGSCGYTAVSNTLVRSDTHEVVATYSSHWEAVKAMLAIPAYKE